MPPRKTPTLQLPPVLGDEIRDVARRAQRSVAFVVHRAILAAKEASPAEISGPTAPLPLTTDDEDPPNLLAKLPAKNLDQMLAAAWPLAREKFYAWLSRLEEAAQAERADDLDEQLQKAADPATGAAHLAELSQSEYPKVRALVASHRNTAADVISRLANDRERSVREAASARA